MKLNHDETKREIESIRNEIRSIANEAIDFNNKKGEIINNELMSDFGKAEQRRVIEEKFKSVCLAINDNIQESLDRILEIETKNNAMFDVADNELQASIQLIKSVNGKLETETIDNIVNSFKGNKQALIMLKSIFEAYDIDTKYIDKYIIDIDGFIGERKELVYSLTADANTTTHKMQKLCNDLYRLAENLGIQFSEEEKDTGISLEEYYDSMARSAMGL